MGASITTPPYQHPAAKQCDIAYAKMLIGSYIGDGNDNRNINIGVNLQTKQKVLVLVKSGSGHWSYFRFSNMGSGQSTNHGATGMLPNFIQSFTTTGFEIGTDSSVNGNGVNYKFVIFYEES